jgi:alpha-galactosidase
VQATVAHSRAEALAEANVVLVSVWLHEAHERLDSVQGRLGFSLPEEGPGVAGRALACAPWSLGVAHEMRERCPGALFVTLMNPTDVIAGIVNEAGGVRAAGLCVEVDGLRGALSYHLRVPAERIVLIHAGVNHDGWVLDFTVNGRDGFALLRSRRHEILQDADCHPGTRGIWPILDLTGHLRSSAYHNWPYSVERGQEPADARGRWGGKREWYEAAVTHAFRTGQPISDPPLIHPERSRLNYPYTGRAVGRLLESVATGEANCIPLQVPNLGAVSNFPEKAIVEVPTLVQGDALAPQPVGELPEWLSGYTRLLAVQRRLIVEYVLDRRQETLRRALAVLPMFGTVQQLNRLAEALHEGFSLTT